MTLFPALPEFVTLVVDEHRSLAGEFRPRYLRLMAEPESQERDDKLEALYEEILDRQIFRNGQPPLERDHAHLLVLGRPLQAAVVRLLEPDLDAINVFDRPLRLNAGLLYLTQMGWPKALERVGRTLQAVEGKFPALLQMARDEDQMWRDARSEGPA